MIRDDHYLVTGPGAEDSKRVDLMVKSFSHVGTVVDCQFCLPLHFGSWHHNYHRTTCCCVTRGPACFQPKLLRRVDRVGLLPASRHCSAARAPATGPASVRRDPSWSHAWCRQPQVVTTLLLATRPRGPSRIDGARDGRPRVAPRLNRVIWTEIHLALMRTTAAARHIVRYLLRTNCIEASKDIDFCAVICPAATQHNVLEALAVGYDRCQ